MSNVGDGNLAGKVGSALDGHGKWDAVAKTIGNKVSEAENDLQLAFSTAEGDLASVRALMERYGYTKEEREAVTTQTAGNVLEAIQIMVKNRYERAQRSLATLTQIISNAHSTLMRIIQNIRTN